MYSVSQQHQTLAVVLLVVDDCCRPDSPTLSSRIRSQHCLLGKLCSAHGPCDEATKKQLTNIAGEERSSRSAHSR